MIRSMTGYACSKYEIDNREYTVEIKSVNHKYNDITIKLPRFLNKIEDNIRKKVAEYISRGKVEVYISFQNYSEKGRNIKVNKELAKVYIQELKELANETGIIDNLNVIDVSKLPDVLSMESDEDEELISKKLNIALEEALNSFVAMREKEGTRLVNDIQERINKISDTVEEISKFSTGLIEEYVVKLEKRIKELLKVDVIDETRIAQEVVIYSDKCSIEEEVTRLRSHIAQFNDMLKKDSPIGKKFDFLIQEMNREINTIGSKANCLEITNRVVEVKTEIENIREQVQNIE